MALKEHMRPSPPVRTQASKAGRKVAAQSRSVTLAEKVRRSGSGPPCTAKCLHLLPEPSVFGVRRRKPSFKFTALPSRFRETCGSRRLGAPGCRRDVLRVIALEAADELPRHRGGEHGALAVPSLGGKSMFLNSDANRLFALT